MQVILIYGEGEETAAGVLLGKTAIELAGRIQQISAGESQAPAFRCFTLTTEPLNASGAQSFTRSRAYPFRGSDSK